MKSDLDRQEAQTDEGGYDDTLQSGREGSSLSLRKLLVDGRRKG
jgi:hypothetical protein